MSIQKKAYFTFRINYETMDPLITAQNLFCCSRGLTTFGRYDLNALLVKQIQNILPNIAHAFWMASTRAVLHGGCEDGQTRG